MGKEENQENRFMLEISLRKQNRHQVWMDEGNWVGEGMGREGEMSKRNQVRGEPEGKSTGRERERAGIFGGGGWISGTN